MPGVVPRGVRKRAFGRDPEAYDRARLRYPQRVYEILTRRCGLQPGAVAFEIGPGTGIASRELLRLGASPLTLIEPDRRLARFLARSLGARASNVRILVEPFERAALPPASFDLGVAATSFHWLPERLALRKIARALRPGGWLAHWNNHHGDPDHPGRFHRALQPVYAELSRGSSARGETKARAARNRRNRLRALRSIGKFDRVSCEEIRWNVTLGTSRMKALWGSFSEIATLPPRKRAWFLAELGRVVDEQFGSEVKLRMVTPIYTARRV
jgi:SAM-dependent methyltransferase